MFNNLRKFEYQRSAEEALGFYLTYTLGLLIALPLIGTLLVMSGFLGQTKEQIAILGGVVGCAVGVLYCGGFAIRIVAAKNMMTWHSGVLVLLAMLAAIVHGLVGMMVVAYMTTRPVNWMMPEKTESRPQRRPAGYEPQAKPEEDSEIVRQYEEVMSKVGRKTIDRSRPDFVEDYDSKMKDADKDKK